MSDDSITLLAERGHWLRAEAEQKLPRLDHESARNRLEELLTSDVSSESKREAAWGLGVIEAEDAVPTLLDCVRMTDDPMVRESVFEALTDIGGDEVRDALVAALDDECLETDAALVTALAEVGDDGTGIVSDRLGQLFDTADSPEVRAAALGGLGGQRGVDRLFSSLIADAVAVRRVAAKQLKARAAATHVPTRASTAFRNRLREERRVLATALGDDDPDVRALVVQIVGYGAVVELRERLAEVADSDPDERVRAVATETLDEM